MKKHNRTPKMLLILLLLGAAAFVLCGIRLEWFVTRETVTPPTCTEDGYTLRRGYFHREKKIDPVPAPGHDYLGATNDPTCLAGGVTVYTCTRCAHSYEDDYTEPAGHSYTRQLISPTCTAPGYTQYRCESCGHEYRDGETAPHGHRYTFAVTLSTCTEGGYTTYTCTACGDSYRDSETPPLAHSNQTVITPPTCTTPGYTLTVCRTCAHAELTDPREATGHRHTAAVTAATCTAPGFTTHTCPDCGDAYTTDHISALGHKYQSVFTPATTTQTGGTTHTCIRCPDSYVTDAFSFSEVFDGRQGDGNGILCEGIDLSHHNGDVDFAALKAAGIRFVILRAGTSRTPDSRFEEYYEAARIAGLDIGCYLYTYADSPDAALQDVEWLLTRLEGKQFEYPIFFDIEDASLQSLTPTELTDITLTFCNAMVDAGYYPGVYTNKRWITDHLEIGRINAVYDVWLASWIVTGENISDYSDDFGMWQYTAAGEVAGVSTPVDRNGAYRDYPAYIKGYGYNGFGT